MSEHPVASRLSSPSMHTALLVAAGSGLDLEEAKNVPIGELADRYREQFYTGRTLPKKWRLKQLEGIRRLFEENRPAIMEALYQDLHKPALEVEMAEFGQVLHEVDLALANLDSWMKVDTLPSPMMVQPSNSYMYKDPLGAVLIIAPWNFPFQLLFSPLVGAVAAGNCCVLKPSELTPASSALIARLVPRYLDRQCITVVEGAVKETTELLAQRWDLIFFTGSTAVGKIVMAAAAKHLTPVVLELGGKCPVYVDSSASLEATARRIVWGKFQNCGQVCLSADYILCHEAVYQPLLDRMKELVVEYFGAEPKQSESLGRVVSLNHTRRLAGLLDDGPNGKFKVLVGGKEAIDLDTKYIPPTILYDVEPSAKVMDDEIFGPLLPVLRVRDHQEAIRFINAKPKPLALYVFAASSSVVQEMLTRTSSGGVTVNDIMMHIVNSNIPFGGVGQSGIGAYHGKLSFDVFTHQKGVLWTKTWADVPQRYPPYTADKLKFLSTVSSMQGFFVRNGIGCPSAHTLLTLFFFLAACALAVLFALCQERIL